MSSYNDLKKIMKEKVQTTGSSRYSKKDHISLTHALLNEPDVEVNVFIKDDESDSGYVTSTLKPVEKYRESLKPVLSQFGIDKSEQDKIQTVEFPKAHAEALNDLAMVSMKEYMDTGRTVVFPITDESDVQLEISKHNVPEKSEETFKPVEENGEYKRVPTGNKKTTREHSAYKVGNKVPGWLITVEKM